MLKHQAPFCVVWGNKKNPMTGMAKGLEVRINLACLTSLIGYTGRLGTKTKRHGNNPSLILGDVYASS